VGRAEAPQVALLGTDVELRVREDTGQMLAVLQRDDVVGVAVEEVHGDAHVADLEAPGPPEKRDVLEQRFHVGAAAVDDVFLEHPANRGIIEHQLVAGRQELREEEGRAIGERVEELNEPAQMGPRDGVIDAAPPSAASGPTDGATPPRTAAPTTRSGISCAHASA
jgi:hypothetical protein